jgi:hypothetical protein
MPLYSSQVVRSHRIQIIRENPWADLVASTRIIMKFEAESISLRVFIL